MGYISTWDSTWYLYSNSRTTYSQLMITACKVESENKEAWDKVRARSAVTTKPVEGTTELENQIAKLMAALTREGQGNSLSSAPNSPGHRGCGRGGMDKNTLSCPNSQNGQTGPELTASAHSVSASHSTWTTSQSQWNSQGSKDSQGSTSNRKDNSFPPVLQVPRLGPHGSGMYHPSKGFKPVRGNQGNAVHPPLVPAATANSRSQHSLPDPKPKPTILKAVQKKG